MVTLKISRKIASVFFELSPEDAGKKIDISTDDLFFIAALMIAIGLMPFLIIILVNN